MSASVSSQTSIGSHYASDLPLFALYANANHVLAMGARVIGRVHTVSVWVLLNVALDATLSLIVSSLAPVCFFIQDYWIFVPPASCPLADLWVCMHC